MKNKTRLYVSRKNAFPWLMLVCMILSAATRIAAFGMKGTESAQVWIQVVLPVGAALLYALIVLLDGQEHFYRTAIPIWLIAYCWGRGLSVFAYGALGKTAFWVCVFAFAVVYTMLTSSLSNRYWITIPIYLSLITWLLYLYRNNLLSIDVHLADLLMITGWGLVTFGTKVHPADEYHPTWGDRADGRRIRSLSPIAAVSSYFMVNRNGSTNLFESHLEVTEIDKYIRRKRKEGLTSFGINHVLLAAYVRGVAKYPAVNRFLSGQKIYTHGNDIQYCMTVKKEMTVESPDTVIKVHLTPYDTADDVYKKLSAAVNEVKNTPLDSSFDGVTHALTMIPGVFLKFAVWLLKTLDYFGLLPKFLLEVSPFHGSIYFTSMGSLGIPAVYHHLYDFGNMPAFCAFSMKRYANEVQDDGSVVQKKYIDMRLTLDERIVDGYYYAAFYRHFMRILAHPEILDHPPETVVSDID